MALQHFQASEFANVSNLSSLSLFICHLFISGKFQYGHLLYDSRVFNDHFTVQIDLNCPHHIPWLVTDISRISHSEQPDQTSFRFLKMTYQHQHTDHILQLIFFDPAYLMHQIAEFSKYLTFYRIFAFSSSTRFKFDANQLSHVISEMSPIFNSRPLIVQYNPNIATVNVKLTLKSEKWTKFEYRNVNISNEHGQMAELMYEHLFDRTFGKYDRERWTEIRIPGIYDMDKGHKMVKSLYGQLYIGNFFMSRLKMSYINMTFIRDDGSSNVWPDRVVVQMQHKFYREISLDYKSFNVPNG